MANPVGDTGFASAGSQLQTQLYVNEGTAQLDDAIRAEFPELAGAAFEWRSPLTADGYREYKDAAFLDAVGQGAHAEALKAFWPLSGPRWDALAVVHGPGDVEHGALLVEGKSYPNEMLKGSAVASPAGTPNRELIDNALAWTREQLGVTDDAAAAWSGPLYQNANRLGHLTWLRSRGVRAWLVHLLFTGDPHGPTTDTEWEAAVALADERLGLEGVAVPGAGHVLLPVGSHEALASS